MKINEKTNWTESGRKKVRIKEGIMIGKYEEKKEI